MNKLTLIIGIQGSGKSHLVNILKDKNTILLSCDKIREEYPTLRENAIWEIFYKKLSLAKRENKDIIIDNTNIKRKWRQEIINYCKDKEFFIQALVCECPLNICIKRNNQRERVVPEEIIQKYFKEFEAPDYDEGFSAILYLNTVNNNIYTDNIMDNE